MAKARKGAKKAQVNPGAVPLLPPQDQVNTLGVQGVGLNPPPSHIRSRLKEALSRIECLRWTDMERFAREHEGACGMLRQLVSDMERLGL